MCPLPCMKLVKLAHMSKKGIIPNFFLSQILVATNCNGVFNRVIIYHSVKLKPISVSRISGRECLK